MFENRREAERRGMIKAEVEIDRKIVNFVTTHLDYQFEDGRLFETEQLMRHLEGTKGPLIVVADLNDVPEGSAYKLMRTKFDDAWVTSRANGDGFSYPADKPVKRIDHIFYRTGASYSRKKGVGCGHFGFGPRSGRRRVGDKLESHKSPVSKPPSETHSKDSYA